ncbi:hypothetical protein CTA1_6727 [Colletotrichum tanaceti]|uniref:Uncharacterized protein n=1 Tax=Colletotrichum tanaceti TaxID=1306861 RepID=A0A4U6XPI4_9PEZI|nr:hypothetical protein CTA1_6727 [Colletotrichum tanaceti]
MATRWPTTEFCCQVRRADRGPKTLRRYLPPLSPGGPEDIRVSSAPSLPSGNANSDPARPFILLE